MPEAASQSDQPVRDTLFLPDFCNLRSLLATVLSAELLAFVLALAGAGPGELIGKLGLISLLVLWVALCSAGVICVLRNRLVALGDRLAALVVWGLIMAVTLLVAEVAWHWMPIEDSQFLFVVRTLAISAIVAALALRYLYVSHQWQLRERAEHASRLQALQARIRPHFLFNSMNTIASLTRSKPGVAEEIVADLADLFRVALSSERNRSTLAQELELTRRYLSIESHRLGDRLQVNWDVDQLPGEAALPPLLLQPLVENAVYHGVEPAPEGGRIEVSGKLQDDMIALTVRNSLPAGDSASERQGNHMAMENVRLRLEAFFDHRARLMISTVDDHFQVRLLFPKK